MNWLDEIGEKIARLREGGYINDISGELPYERMARVIRALVKFIWLNIDFDSPLRPVGLRDLPPDARELLGWRWWV